MKPNKRYDELMRYVGKIEAVLLLLQDIEDIEYNSISEEDYDELITQPASKIFEAKEIIEKYAKSSIKWH